MWTTMLCHPSAFVKLSVTMASLPHRNCPSDSQVYIAMGSRTLRGELGRQGGEEGGREGGRCGGNRQKGVLGAGRRRCGDGERES